VNSEKAVQERSKKQKREQDKSKEFNRTVRNSSSAKGSSEASRVPAQRRQFELEFRSIASLAFCLDLEEFKKLFVLSESYSRS
jgi:hypothetical protein